MTVLQRLSAPPPVWYDEADVVVVGSGAAGLSAALSAAAGGRRVLVVTKTTLGSGATAWAQGGLAAVAGADDHARLHAEDTLNAGAGLCDRAAVERLVAQAPAAIAHLVGLGARFDRCPDGSFELGREGGHHRDRILHAGGDASGAEVARVLVAAAERAGEQGCLDVLERTQALDADVDANGHVTGVRVLDGRGVGVISTRALVLATGGLGQAYSATSNPLEATGDGIAIALRAGAVLSDLEFVQFHPTLLHTPGQAYPVLVSEAVRGEGAVLVDAHGERVMRGLHPMADLAPRDVVASSMHARMVRAGTDHLYLDGTHLGRACWEHRFPTILAACRAVDIDPLTAPVPVAPAAHYACGGVRASLDGGTDVPGLFAVGEVAATGVHGANRLASNSVTEGLVAGRLLGARLARALPPTTGTTVESAWSTLIDPGSRAATAGATGRLAGVLRDPDDLQRLLDLLDAAPTTWECNAASVEASNLHLVSTVIARSALVREESRGAHRRTDVTAASPSWQRHLEVRLDRADRAVLTALSVGYGHREVAA